MRRDHTFSRRAVVAGLAVAPTLSATTAVANADMALIALGRKLNATRTASQVLDQEPQTLDGSSGWPNAGNTGIRPGITLTNFTGSLVSSQAGQIIENLNVTGPIVITHNNVTVRNCRVDASGQSYGIGIPERAQVNGCKVFYCEVFGRSNPGDPNSRVDSAVAGWRNHTNNTRGEFEEIAFCNIWGCVNGICGGTGYMHDNYIHDFCLYNGIDLHDDGLQTYGWAGTGTQSGGLRFIHNTVVGIITKGDPITQWPPEHPLPATFGNTSSCIALSQGMHDITIDNNWFEGGGYVMYGPGAGSPNVRI